MDREPHGIYFPFTRYPFFKSIRQMKRFLLAIILTILVVPAFAHVIPEMGIDVRPSYTFFLLSG